jgi:hypothetical protein
MSTVIVISETGILTNELLKSCVLLLLLLDPFDELMGPLKHVHVLSEHPNVALNASYCPVTQHIQQEYGYKKHRMLNFIGTNSVTLYRHRHFTVL